jgi:hypothetical protein
MTSAGLASVTCHTGKDYFTAAEADRLLAFAARCAARLGLDGRVHHETHRSRILYSPWVARDVCARHPALTLVADYSHFTVVAEAAPSDPELDACVLGALNARVRHVHARVGFEEGPQVPDPRGASWTPYLVGFARWWADIYARAIARGDTSATTTPEFGPPPYCWTTPFDDAPLADMWEVNHFVGGHCTDVFARVAAAAEAVPTHGRVGQEDDSLPAAAVTAVASLRSAARPAELKLLPAAIADLRRDQQHQ